MYNKVEHYSPESVVLIIALLMAIGKKKAKNIYIYIYTFFMKKNEMTMLPCSNVIVFPL